MGVKSDVFLIITGDSRKLSRVQKKAKTLWKQHSALRGYITCVGEVAGGIHRSFLTISPTGSQAGWEPAVAYERVLELLKEYLDTQEIDYDQICWGENHIALDNNYHHLPVKTSYVEKKESYEEKKTRTSKTRP